MYLCPTNYRSTRDKYTEIKEIPMSVSPTLTTPEAKRYPPKYADRTNKAARTNDTHGLET